MRKHGTKGGRAISWVNRETEEKRRQVSVKSGNETYLWSVSTDRRQIIKH
jgi:hypothetical protein